MIAEPRQAIALAVGIVFFGLTMLGWVILGVVLLGVAPATVETFREFQTALPQVTVALINGVAALRTLAGGAACAVVVAALVVGNYTLLRNRSTRVIGALAGALVLAVQAIILLLTWIAMYIPLVEMEEALRQAA